MRPPRDLPPTSPAAPGSPGGAHRRALRVAGIAALLAGVAVAAAAVGASVADDGQVTPGAAAAPRPISGALADAPWLVQTGGARRIGAEPARAALHFPAGVDYSAALRALYLSAVGAGTVPDGAIVVDALPAGIVLRETPTGIEVSLTAAWGYDPDSGAIRLPSYRLSSDLTPAQVQRAIAAAQAAGDPLPTGAEVDVPALDPCQVQHATGARPAPCPALEVAP